MNGRERGFLLLTSHLGDPDRKVLTVPQLRVLAQAVAGSGISDATGEVQEKDLMDLGFNRGSAQRILQLLAEEERLDCYLRDGVQADCLAITRVSDAYPLRVRTRLGLDSPGCLWVKGDPTLLSLPAVSLVGSRDLREDNLVFAQMVGKQAARQGLVLISGNARGADTAAQEACLGHGGKVISVVADRLMEHSLQENVLYVSEDGYDLPFSSQRALSRNRVIHALGNAVLVAQCTLGKGGTWDGTVKNLKGGWSPVYCFCDGSEAFAQLTQMGAKPICMEQLSDLQSLKADANLFDQCEADML